MHETAKHIRQELKAAGLRGSVVCRSNYCIAVITEDPKRVTPIVLKAYHAEPHHWLMVRVNSNFLPMPK